MVVIIVVVVVVVVAVVVVVVGAAVAGPTRLGHQELVGATLFLEEPSADYHLCDIRCQAIHSLGPLSSKTS